MSEIIIGVLIITMLAIVGHRLVAWWDFRRIWKISEKNGDDFRAMANEWSKQ